MLLLKRERGENREMRVGARVMRERSERPGRALGWLLEGVGGR